MTRPGTAPLLRWALVGLLLALAGGTALVRWDIAQRREAFATDARIAHRLLSQRAVEVEAVLATVALLDVPAATRLPALHPAILRVGREPRVADGTPQPTLDATALERGQVRLVLDGAEARHTMDIDLARLVPSGSWPLGDDGPVRAELRLAGQAWVLHPGAAPGTAPRGLTAGFVAAKALDAAALRLDLHLQRATGPAEWPWARLALMTLAIAAVMAAAAALQAQRERRRRAEELLRLDRMGRLNALGEMAAGLAHELNQPLAAALAQTQAARRQLADIEAPADDEARAAATEALTQAAAQTRRAADIVKRLREGLERPAAATEAVDLAALLDEAAQLRLPELRAAGVALQPAQGRGPELQADPVALQQIVHNLIGNALQALQSPGAPPPGRRVLTLALHTGTDAVRLVVADNGPGIAPELLPTLFHPFVSGREGGLGLGLSLCESLATAQGGHIAARNRTAAEGGGAEFTLTLPLPPPLVQHHGP
jgi:signal transduction histidine kinase